jgi:hypothetical protein
MADLRKHYRLLMADKARTARINGLSDSEYKNLIFGTPPSWRARSENVKAEVRKSASAPRRKDPKPSANLKRDRVAASPRKVSSNETAAIARAVAAAREAGGHPTRQDQSVATAAAILAAAVMARAGGPERKAPSGDAAAILAAAAMRNTGGPPREAPSGTAAAILAAGKKRRGEAE